MASVRLASATQCNYSSCLERPRTKSWCVSPVFACVRVPVTSLCFISAVSLMWSHKISGGKKIFHPRHRNLSHPEQICPLAFSQQLCIMRLRHLSKRASHISQNISLYCGRELECASHLTVRRCCLGAVALNSLKYNKAGKFNTPAETKV